MTNIESTIKRYAVSSASTFLSMFFMSLAIQLGNGTGLQFTGAFVVGILSVAFRAAGKAVIETFVGQHADLQV